jgi:hypothetical protein
MRLSKSSTISRHSPLIPVSLFDAESRFFAPTHTCWKPARAGAVKAGRRSVLASRSIVSRPRLDRPEHGGLLVVVGMTRPRGARCRGTRDSRRNLVSGGSIRTPDHDASMRISGEAPRRRTHSRNRCQHHGLLRVTATSVRNRIPTMFVGSETVSFPSSSSHAARNTTPAGTSPVVTRRHRAISNLRAMATIMVLRVPRAFSVRA